MSSREKRRREFAGISLAKMDPGIMDCLRKGAVYRVQGNENPVHDRESVPFMLSRNEEPVWCWHDVEMHERTPATG